MSLTIRKTSNFELAPAGSHYATCIGIYDIGTQATEFGPKPKIVLMFELTDTLMQDGRPYVVRGMYNVSLNKNKAGKGGPLLALLESWRGQPYTDEELDNLDLRRAVGRPAILNIVHSRSGEATYANIASASPLLKGMAKLTPHNKPIYYEIENGPAFPDGMPEWIIDKVKASAEWTDSIAQTDADEPANVAADDDAVF